MAWPLEDFLVFNCDRVVVYHTYKEGQEDFQNLLEVRYGTERSSQSRLRYVHQDTQLRCSALRSSLMQ